MLKVDYAYGQIRGKILAGQVKPGEKLPSSIQLAQTYQVAHMTMRKALKRLADEGYLNLSHGKGIFVADKPEDRHAALVINSQVDIHAIFPEVLQRELLRLGYYATSFELDTLADHVEMFLDFFDHPGRLLIFDGSHHFPWDILDRLPAGTRKIAIHRDESSREYPIAYVLKDAAKCAYLAADALLSRGLRRLAVVGDEYLMPGHARDAFHEGLDSALKQHGLGRQDRIRYFPSHLSEMEWRELLGSDRRPDGFIGCRDSVLVPLYVSATGLGMKIPDDLALVGCNNTPWAGFLNFTSIDIRPEEIATQLGRVLESSSQERIIVSPQIIYRQSCPQVQ